MDINHRQLIFYMYGFLLMCFISGITYSFGYNRGYADKSHPIYIKYAIHTKSLAILLKDVGVVATPKQIEKLGNAMKGK